GAFAVVVGHGCSPAPPKNSELGDYPDVSCGGDRDPAQCHRGSSGDAGESQPDGNPSSSDVRDARRNAGRGDDARTTEPDGGSGDDGGNTEPDDGGGGDDAGSSDGYTLVAQPATVAPGAPITVSWTAPPGEARPDDWIAYYLVGTPNTEHI